MRQTPPFAGLSTKLDYWWKLIKVSVSFAGSLCFFSCRLWWPFCKGRTCKVRSLDSWYCQWCRVVVTNPAPVICRRRCVTDVLSYASFFFFHNPGFYNFWEFRICTHLSVRLACFYVHFVQCKDLATTMVRMWNFPVTMYPGHWPG